MFAEMIKYLSELSVLFSIAYPLSDWFQNHIDQLSNSNHFLLLYLFMLIFLDLETHLAFINHHFEEIFQ